ncbi:putative PAN2-PAN3 deadenylation complex catalytic subunit PAN2 [Seiridium cardinale]|uniref:PAN2-PAN3 deadenylation complex catalytic subunit PAN2 n=1 Tax=Seiridium cardinale TaxID=138064 RepID=A0ABR2XAT5_9PEZI
MDADWDEVSQTPLPPPGLRAHHTPVTTLAFDTSQELLWAANEYGRVTSFYGTTLLNQYTSFKAHGSQDGKVHQLLFNDKGVIALGSRSVHMSLRRGPPLWNIRHEGMTDLRCMTFTSKGTAEIIVAGEQDKMFVIDVNKGEVVKVLPAEAHYKIMKRSRYICAATTGSAVHILDPLSFKVIKQWAPHAGIVHDMDAQHDYIVTCGLTLRSGYTQPQYMCDLFVNVFDLKNMASMNPVPFPAGGAYVRMHPRMSTTSIVVSQHGQIHVVDLMNPNSTSVRQTGLLVLPSAFDIAPSGEAMALADDKCNIHLWGSINKMHFAEVPTQIEWANAETQAPDVDWDDRTPMNSVGIPFYRETLLSAWPTEAVYEVGAQPPRDDPQFLSTLQRRDWGLYGKNTRGLRRNQSEDTRRLQNTKEFGLLNKPKFLSEQARELQHSPAGTPAPEEILNDPLSEITNRALESHKVTVPELYQSIDIQYSKFGIDDFDFGFYNKTSYAGLQNHIMHCYANALLQAMFFTPAIRNIALQHTASRCYDELCLLCELGFLFDMLSKAGAAPCHASNLLKVVSYYPQANLNLLDGRPHSPSRSAMLQNFSRFILPQIVIDHRRIEQSDVMDKLLKTETTTTIRCQVCGVEVSKPASSYSHDLIYALSKPGSRHAKSPRVTFSQILKKSIEKDLNTKGFCHNCRGYKMLSSRKVTHQLPVVLTLFAGNINDETRRLWAIPGWLPEEIGIIVANGEFFCYEGDELKSLLDRQQRGQLQHHIVVYSLTALAVDIDTGSKDGHLVTLANVAHSAETAPGKSQWHLFNDFHVIPVTREEALAFNASWKMPSVLTFQLKDANNKIDQSWKAKLDTNLLYHDFKPDLSDKTYRTLSEGTETVTPDTVIAIDTEFVSTSSAEIEITSDGDERTIRPTVHALARTSVLRGNGIDEGVPFIDDYVHIRDTVVDYLTAYSGIVPEDLDPKRTKHTLVPLKIVYKKMWILLNLGCKFLGHGLKQDFRVINIHVPRDQIIDTSDLFFEPAKKRKLSLQFLAWHLLKEDIQLETHDSIEDARTALRLYRKYQEFTDAGVFKSVLQEIYNKGFSMNFKPPSRQGNLAANVPRTDTPPIDGPSTPGRKTGGMGIFGASPSWKDSPASSKLR